MNSVFSLKLENVGKQFYRRSLFQGLSLELNSGDSLALVGTNGSGKSTMLRIIAGQLAPSTGKVSYRLGDRLIPSAERYQFLSWSAPYISLFPELTIREQFRLQQQFKKALLSEKEFLTILDLEAHADKPLRFFSSGMSQRAKVGLALFAESALILLDEPTSNMDSHYASLMLGLIKEYQGDRILVLASNLAREYGELSHQIHLGERISP